MYFQTITWIISVLALTGTILNANRNKCGFLLWFITNLFWVIVDFRSGLYAQSTLFLAYTLLAIKGWTTWSKAENGTNLKIER